MGPGAGNTKPHQVASKHVAEAGVKIHLQSFDEVKQTAVGRPNLVCKKMFALVSFKF